MPRVFTHIDEPAVLDENEDASAGQAARQVAIAITMLMVSLLVLIRSHEALGAGVAATSRITSGEVELTDDDDGKTLFELPSLRPGEVISNCITVTYRGNVFGESVNLRFRGGGELAEHLETTIELGTGGGFDACDQFRPTDTLYQGSLDGLHRAHGPASDGLETFAIEQTPETRTFRISFGLADDSTASGLDASSDFLWTVGG